MFSMFQALVYFLASTYLVFECTASPLKFPDGTEVNPAEEARVAGNSEARFHNFHQKRKKMKKKPGCGHFNNRFKRASPESRFFFPILNIYETDIYVNNRPYEGQPDSGCESGFGQGGGGHPLISGLGGGGAGSHPIISGLGGGLGNVGSAISNGLGGLTSTISNLGSGLGNFPGNLPSIGAGIPPISSPPSRPPVPSRPPPPAPVNPPSPVPSRPPALVTTTDPDNEDYDYTDFSTTVRSRPTGNRISLSDYPLVYSISNNLRPAIDRPQKYFNQYVVRPINRTIREFYSLF